MHALSYAEVEKEIRRNERIAGFVMALSAGAAAMAWHRAERYRRDQGSRSATNTNGSVFTGQR